MSVSEKVNCFVFQSVVYIEGTFQIGAAVSLHDELCSSDETRLSKLVDVILTGTVRKRREILHLGVELLSHINASIDPN